MVYDVIVLNVFKVNLVNDVDIVIKGIVEVNVFVVVKVNNKEIGKVKVNVKG